MYRILLLIWIVAAARSPDQEARFREGIALYREGKLEKALAAFRDAAVGPEGQTAQAARVMQAKVLYGMGEYSQAREVLEEFLSLYPRGPYAAYAEYLLGHCAARTGRFGEAVRHYRRASQLAGKGKLKDRAQAMLRVLEGHKVQRPSPRIAILGPFTGPDREFGCALRRGAELAYELLPPDERKAILTYRDTGGDPIRTVKEIQALAAQEEVVAVVGPVFASSAIPAAALADAEGLPLLAPAVTEEGFASIGPYVFQLNLSPLLQGRRIAEAALGLGLNTFVILASVDDYGREMAQGFAETVEAGGGRVLTVEWYAPGTTDFSEACRRIRRAGWVVLRQRWSEELRTFWEAFSEEVPLDTTATLPDTTLKELFWTWVSQDSSLEVPEGAVRAWAAGGDSTLDAWFEAYEDTAETPISISIDGFLVAGGTEEILQIVPQVAFHRIRTRFLGGQAWNDPQVPLTIGEYAEGALFSAVFFPDASEEAVQRFVGEYRRRYGRDPGLVDALSYDAVSLVLKALDRAGPNREEIRRALAGVKGYRGASGEVSFSEDGANVSAYILELTRNRIQLVDKAHYTSE